MYPFVHEFRCDLLRTEAFVDFWFNSCTSSVALTTKTLAFLVGLAFFEEDFELLDSTSRATLSGDDYSLRVNCDPSMESYSAYSSSSRSSSSSLARLIVKVTAFLVLKGSLSLFSLARIALSYLFV